MTEQQVKELNSRLDVISHGNTDYMDSSKSLRSSMFRCEALILFIGLVMLFSVYLEIKTFGYFDSALEAFRSRNSDERLSMIEMRLKNLSGSIELITKDLERKGELIKPAKEQ